MNIRLFIKPYCPWCHKATAWLDARTITSVTLDVIADNEAFAEMREISGQTLAPVIDVDGEVHVLRDLTGLVPARHPRLMSAMPAEALVCADFLSIRSASWLPSRPRYQPEGSVASPRP